MLLSEVMEQLMHLGVVKDSSVPCQLSVSMATPGTGWGGGEKNNRSPSQVLVGLHLNSNG